MRCLATVGAMICLQLLLAWAYLSTETELSGDDFMVVAVIGAAHSYGSQELYREDEASYCIRVGQPFATKKFCVPKSDLEIHNAAGGGAKLGAIGKREMSLKEGRYPGANRETF